MSKWVFHSLGKWFDFRICFLAHAGSSVQWKTLWCEATTAAVCVTFQHGVRVS